MSDKFPIICEVYDCDIYDIIVPESRDLFHAMMNLAGMIVTDADVEKTEKVHYLLKVLEYVTPDANFEEDQEEDGRTLKDMAKRVFGKTKE